MRTQQIKVLGKVQGVYFRASAKQKAMNLGIHGFIKNQQDGSVVLEIEGDEDAVNNMVNWCKQGPALARVSNIEVKNEAARNFVSFDIKK